MKKFFENLKRIVLYFVKRLSPKLYEVLSTQLNKRLIKGSFWSILGGVVYKALMLLSSIIVARLIAKSEFGEYGLIRSTISMFAAFAGFGIGMTSTKYIAQYKKISKERTGRFIGITTLFGVFTSLLIVVVINIMAPYLAKETLNAPHLEMELRLASLILLFTTLSGIQSGILVGFESFKTIAKINFIGGALAFPIQISLTYLYGLKGAIIGYGSVFFISWLLYITAVTRETEKSNIKIDYRNSFKEWKILYQFSLPAFFASLLFSGVHWTSNVILVNSENGYLEMAFYEAANQWRIMILFLPTMVAQIVLPILSEKSEDKGSFLKIFKLNIKINALMSSLAALFVLVLSPYLMGLYGDGFDKEYLVLLVLAIATIFVSVNEVIVRTIASKNKLWLNLGINIVWGALQIGLTYYFVNQGHGALGLVLALLISYAVRGVIQLMYIKTITK